MEVSTLALSPEHTEQQIPPHRHPTVWNADLTLLRIPWRMGFGPMMRLSRKLFPVSGLVPCLFLSLACVAQNPPESSAPPVTPKAEQSRITIEVTGGDKDVPVENASVYLMYIEEHKIKKNKKLELNVKTSREGLAHVPDAPPGRVRIQVIAEGWKTFGRWYDIDDPQQVIKIHLERPPKWY